VNPECAHLIRREAVILKTLKHPLVLEFQGEISAKSSENSAIVTEFAGNGSLRNYLPPAKRRLSGANRIARIVVGIALAMRYIHSQNITHRDLKPDNILLDWDWNVRIADFDQSIWSNKSESPSLIGFDEVKAWPSINSHYLAPECYEHKYPPASDVFSFALILYTLLVGQLAFPEELTRYQIAHKVVINNERPEIPEFILPKSRELITDCWEVDPDDRPTFDEIVNRLKNMKFQLIPNVNSSKLSEFVKRIEEWEAQKVQNSN
jgi:serine/threonine protein kinase